MYIISYVYLEINRWKIHLALGVEIPFRLSGLNEYEDQFLLQGQHL